jgi:hypothetical protein
MTRAFSRTPTRRLVSAALCAVVAIGVAAQTSPAGGTGAPTSPATTIAASSPATSPTLWQLQGRPFLSLQATWGPGRATYTLYFRTRGRYVHDLIDGPYGHVLAPTMQGIGTNGDFGDVSVKRSCWLVGINPAHRSRKLVSTPEQRAGSKVPIRFYLPGAPRQDRKALVVDTKKAQDAAFRALGCPVQ